jgi:hypothetical protein
MNFSSIVLLFISKKNNSDYLETSDIERFFELINGKRVYDPELNEKISTKLVDKYKDLFPNDNNKFYLRKMALVLEQFFDMR